MKQRPSSTGAHSDIKRPAERVPFGAVEVSAAAAISGKDSLRMIPTNGTLSDRVYAALKSDIIRCVYQPGEALSEKILAKKYQGSRTPVREAAVRLQQEQLVHIVPNRGYFVTPITIQYVNEIYEFRAAVEGMSAELAAQKTPNKERMDRLFELAQTEHRLEDRASYVRFIEADTEFHVGIAELTRNLLLIRAVADMRCQMERIMYASSPPKSLVVLDTRLLARRPSCK